VDLPTVLYRCPGPHSRAGGTYDFLGVESPESYEAAIAAGWQLTMPDAIAVFEKTRDEVMAEVDREVAAEVKADEPQEPVAPVRNKPGPKPKA
jgi:hypothetical protein